MVFGMNCPNCGTRMNRVGLESVQMGKIMAEFECPQCHTHVSQALQKK